MRLISIHPRLSWTGRLGLAAGVGAWLVVSAGCQELVHMGQISDGESAFAIGNAEVRQQQEDGTWRLLGRTDGNGRWWIMKKDIRSGSLIRITKPGYAPLILREGEFLQKYNLLMVPSGGGSIGEDAGHLWGDDPFRRRDRRRH